MPLWDANRINVFKYLAFSNNIVFFLSDMPPFLENPAAPWGCLCSHFASEVEQEQRPGGSGENEATVVSVKVSHPPRKTGMIENVQALVHAR